MKVWTEGREPSPSRAGKRVHWNWERPVAELVRVLWAY